jgi:hypothetical protein
MSETTKIRKGHYIHIKSGLHIVFCMGEKYGYWNIWDDEEEWQIGIPTKWQCIEKIEKFFTNFN